MPTFAYKAVDAQGRKLKGVRAAASKGAVVDQLTASGVFVTKVFESGKAGAQGNGALRLPFMAGVSARELTLMVRRLATLVSANIPLIRCLDNVTARIENPQFREVMERVKEDVQRGATFSAALARHPAVFSPLMISMTRVGETGGMLDSVLEQLADFVERDRELRGEVKMALAYPTFVLVFAVLIVVFLMTTAVPKLMLLFAGMEHSLPLPTRMLMLASGLVQSYGALAFVMMMAAGGSFLWWRRTPRGRALIDTSKLRIPLIGSLMKKNAIARFARALGALARGGVPLMEALDVVKGVMDNRELTAAVERVQNSLRKGEALATGIGREPVFPEMVASMLAAGEEAGQIDGMLFKIAEVFESETRGAIKVVVGLLAPALILCVALIVMFIALALLLPIFQINQMIR